MRLMKNLTSAACVLLLSLTALVTLGTLSSTVCAQVQSVAAANKQPAPKPPTTAANSANRTNATRARILGQDAKATAAGNTGSGPNLQPNVKPSGKNTTNTSLARVANTTTNNPSANLPSNRARTVSNTTAKPAANNSSVSPLGASFNTSVPANSQIYRIGVRDVLDIQLAGQSTRQSTLFTVIDGGFVEYPLAGGPLVVAGLTAAEVAASLRQRLKILDNPAVVVRVRDYASHTVTISGLVAAPGVKSLRREAVPLYTVLAEALMLPEAARATITRPGHAPILVDLKDSKLTATLVLPGDAIKVSTTPAEFFFVGGEISSPGQKPYHSGVTLTQAILASGGTTRNAGAKVRVSRQGADGRLLTEEHNLRKIQDGKIADPVLQKGDRIQVSEDR